MNHRLLGALTGVACATFGSLISAAPDPLAACDALLAETTPSYWVCLAGSRKHMLKHGDFNAAVALESLAAIDKLQAIGPVTGLRGEVTVVDGEASIATIADDQPAISKDTAGGAVFLVYGAAKDWKTITLPVTLEGLSALEAFVNDEARRLGLPDDAAFPFQLVTTPESLRYHIMFREAEGQSGHKPGGHGHRKEGMAHDHGEAAKPAHDHAAHKRAKRMFDLAPNTVVRLVGFRADTAGMGHYTHDGERIHVHFVGPERTPSGHVDAIVIPAGSRLYLPRP